MMTKKIYFREVTEYSVSITEEDVREHFDLTPVEEITSEMWEETAEFFFWNEPFRIKTEDEETILIAE